ncbi:TIGR01777 family oxidoreductase [Rivularia sp. UHCC 0363]|uniref:thylakoid membrane protein ThyD n=1 Tax=Rivularia sp. UHCC 0363 TaxID=3110244 RepID=UPI002B218E91|nr:TIGR01777 family oxidoreductase [Rivularia sp. UHCC 0363]MEA5598304.1 TIGR01777 family oxidoreductase [Rivularia sp. UHCC 0363]
MKVAITGATGFVGSRLVERLLVENTEVLVLTRDPNRAQKIFPSNAYPNVEIAAYTPSTSGSWQNQIASCEAIVNLAGAPISEGRWTSDRKQSILSSRKLTTQKIVEAIVKSTTKPKVLVNASAVGYYGTSETAIFDENSTPGSDFLAQVCQEWETEAQKVTDSGVRLVILRFGIVLGMGGALGKMITPFKMFAGGPIGSGEQWFSWIHVDDIVSLILQVINSPEMSGIYNATAPHPVRMAELSTTMGEVMNRPSWLPVPAFAIEAMLGDGAVVVLEGQKVLPQRTLQSGFKYDYPNLKPALEEILK